MVIIILYFYKRSFPINIRCKKQLAKGFLYFKVYNEYFMARKRKNYAPNKSGIEPTTSRFLTTELPRSVIMTRYFYFESYTLKRTDGTVIPVHNDASWPIKNQYVF